MFSPKVFFRACKAKSPLEGLSAKDKKQIMQAMVEANKRKRACSVPLAVAQQIGLGKEEVEVKKEDTWFFTSQVSRRERHSVLQQNMVLLENEPPRDSVFLAKEELTRFVRELECPPEFVEEVVETFLHDYVVLKTKLDLVFRNVLDSTREETINGLFKKVEQTVGCYRFVSAGKQIA